MNLAMLTKIADAQTKKRIGKTASAPVRLAVINHNGQAYRFAFYVYNEPRNCHFKDTKYWRPVYYRPAKRIYLIYGDAANGYKKGTQKNAVGYIQFTNYELLEDWKSIIGQKAWAFNWQWDEECSRPYILLSK